MADASAQIPPKCPGCGRITVDNRRHCKPEDGDGHMSFWLDHCRLIVCRACATVYGAFGHYPRKAAA